MGCCSKHVILVPTPAVGHCVPFFYLAARLVHLGAKVTVLVSEGLVEKFQKDALFATHAGEILQRDGVDVVAVDDGFSHLGKAQALFAMLKESSQAQLQAAYAGAVASLMESGATGSSPAPCCIVSDMLMAWTKPLADQFHIPRYVLHTQSATNLSLMLHVPTLLAEGQLPITESNREKPVNIPGLKVPLSTSELPSDLHPGALMMDAYAMFMRTSRRAAEAPIVLINTFRELEDDVFATLDTLHANNPTKMPMVIPVGPLIPTPPFSKPADTLVTSEFDESIMSFLDTQASRSVVYIAFGTAGMMNKEEMFVEIAMGLEASGQPFVWAEGPKPSLPNATTLARSLPPGFVERTKERGMVVSGCAPQLRILEHPATGAFMSHCGWNSILESLTAGMPILAFPLRAEQKMNARYLVDVAKVAAEFKRSTEDLGGIIPRNEVERVVRLVMQQALGKLLRSNVARLKDLGLKNASCTDSMKTFLASCGGNECNPAAMD